MGMMGFGCFAFKNIPYDSQESIEFADELWSLLVIMQLKHQVIWLKKEALIKAGSLWDQGVLPIDSLRKLKVFVMKII